jgi:hypothetical protein
LNRFFRRFYQITAMHEALRITTFASLFKISSAFTSDSVSRYFGLRLAVD